MNREIKFRAWDGEVMIYPNPTSSHPQTMTWEGVCYRNGVVMAYTLMQYTGLKDKNGTPIFESDIVLIPDQYTDVITDDGRGPIETANHLCPVIFKEGEFLFVVEDKADFLDIGEYSYRELKDEVGVDEAEVIGNIFSNPELIKDND